jgi:LCP family protein required for cell wall assembly
MPKTGLTVSKLGLNSLRWQGQRPGCEGEKNDSTWNQKHVTLVYMLLGEVSMPNRDQHGNYQEEFWGEATARAPQKHRRSPLTLILGLVMLAVITFAVFALTGYVIAGRMLRVDLAGVGEEEPVAEAAATKPETVLVIGVDKRDPDEPARSDTIMLAVMDPRKPQVDVISIPRDTRVKIPSYGYDKINAAHAYGGPELLMSTINELLGSRVSKYVEVDFQGFEKIIDVLGGIEIEVDKRMYHPEENIDLQPGLQTLDGHDALGFVRYRKDDPGGDVTRIGRQQLFVQALIDQSLKLSTIPKIPKLVNEIIHYVDTNLSVKDMLSMALAMKNLDTSAVNTYMLPGEGQYINDISYWIIDHKELAEVLAAVPYL